MEWILIGLAAVAALVLLSWVLSRAVLASNARKARRALPPAGPTDVEEAAVGLTAPYKAYGLLRLTPTDLHFASGTAGVLTIPRSAIGGSTASTDVPTGQGMQTLRRPALVVAVRDPSIGQGFAFVVTDPAQWVARLRPGHRR